MEALYIVYNSANSAIWHVDCHIFLGVVGDGAQFQGTPATGAKNPIVLCLP